MFLCVLGVLLCQKLSQCVGKSPFPFPEGQVSFHLPAAGRLSTQIYLGQDVCVHVFIFFFLKVQCCGGQQLILNLGYLTW